MRDKDAGKQVTIRAYNLEHIDRLYEAIAESIDELSKYETWCHPGYTLKDAAKYVNYCRNA